MEENELSKLDAQFRLAAILNDSTRTIRLGKKEYELRALRTGTQWLIAQECCKIAKNEQMSLTDLVKQFATSVPSVCRCITLAILNDKDKIAGEEYQTTYDEILWETSQADWIKVLVEVLQMINLDFFFQASTIVMSFKELTLKMKTKNQEQSSSNPAQS